MSDNDKNAAESSKLRVLIMEDNKETVLEIPKSTMPNENETAGLNDLSEQKADDNVVLDRINQIKCLYDSNNSSLLEVVQQYDLLIDKIAVQKKELESLYGDAMKANELYDKFKRSFGQVVDDFGYGDKLYYAIPIYEDYEEGDEWINRWLEVLREATNDDNKDAIRIYVNQNLYSSIMSLPKDIYCYKPKQKKLTSLTPEVKDAVFLFYARLYSFFRLIKDFSDSLRLVLIKSISLSNEYHIEDSKKSYLPSLEQLNDDEMMVRKSIASGDSDYFETSNRYQEIFDCFTSIMPNILEKPDDFTKAARALYQQCQNYQNEIYSLSKSLYSKSLTEIYKLYDLIVKSLSDFSALQAKIAEEENESKVCCQHFSNVLEDMRNVITEYLFNAYSIKPLQIEVGANFNDYDINWYDVLVSEDAPSVELTECISSIPDSGFAKFDVDDKIEFVSRTAKIAVYGKNVVAISSNDNK